MTLAEMQYIVALAESLHFGQAAKRCGVSQSTLSMAIKKIEDDLPGPLFERTRYKVVITQLGKDLSTQVKKIVEQTQQIEQLAQDFRQDIQGDVYVGAAPSVGPYVLPRLASYWRVVKRKLILHCEDLTPNLLQQKFLRGELDCMITTQKIEPSDGFNQLIFSENFVAVLPQSHRLKQFPWLKLEQLHEFPYLKLDDDDLNREIENFFIPTRLEAVSCNRLDSLYQLLNLGIGFSILPQSIANAWVAQHPHLQIKPLAFPTQRQYFLAWRKSYPRLKFIELLKQDLNQIMGTYVTGSEKNSSGLLIDNENW